MKQITRLMVLVIGLLSIHIVQIPSVRACSGGGLPPWDEYLPHLVDTSDTIVVGQYETVDDARANGIFQVDTYLQGQGAELLLIESRDSRDVRREQNGYRFPTRCEVPRPITTDGQYIYFLSRQMNGVYTVNHLLYFDNTTSDDTPDTPDSTLPERINQIVAGADTEPVPPDADAMTPRERPILLHTTGDTYYLLPVDDNTPVAVPADDVNALRRSQHQCDAPPCTVYSSNGLDKIYLRTPDAPPVSLKYTLPFVESVADGERIIVSPTGDSYALWHNQQIQMYALWYVQYGYPDDRFGEMYTPELIHSTDAADSLTYPVAWLPDGRRLLFSTSDGLWLWDALTIDSEPQLLIPAVDENTVPVVRYVSPQGRYIAVRDGDDYYNVDRVSGQRLPDGYVSPDDRLLLAFDTQATEPATLEIMYLAPGIRSFEYYPEVRYLAVQWKNEQEFIASITGDSYLRYEMGDPIETPPDAESPVYEAIPYLVEEPFYDVVTYQSSGVSSVSYFNVPYGIGSFQMRDFTYDASAGLIQIGVNGQHLIIKQQHVDVSSLPQPVQNAFWLPAILYDADS